MSRLERLIARTDWARLRDAYGSAAELPALLRARASPEDAIAKRAAYELWGRIWHQGTVYEATVAAVPILSALASDPRTVDRADVLLLLSEIAEGFPMLASSGAAATPEAVQWARDARRAVIEEAASVVASTLAADRAVRVAAAGLSCSAAEATAVHIPVLKRSFAEARTLAERSAFAAALLALGVRSQDAESTIADFLSTGSLDEVAQEQANDLLAARPTSVLHLLKELLEHVDRGSDEEH